MLDPAEIELELLEPDRSGLGLSEIVPRSQRIHVRARRGAARLEPRPAFLPPAHSIWLVTLIVAVLAVVFFGAMATVL